MTRSIWKGPFIDPHFVKLGLGALSRLTDREAKEETLVSAKIRRGIWSRRSCILPQFVGFSVQVYNGKKWMNLKITGEMVGHKFGEFASTRTIGTLKDKKAMKTKLKVKIR